MRPIISPVRHGAVTPISALIIRSPNQVTSSNILEHCCRYSRKRKENRAVTTCYVTANINPLRFCAQAVCPAATTAGGPTPRLIARLNEDCTATDPHRLPAGFGKTTLISEWGRVRATRRVAVAGRRGRRPTALSHIPHQRLADADPKRRQRDRAEHGPGCIGRA
jgi:hypothetical protein